MLWWLSHFHFGVLKKCNKKFCLGKSLHKNVGFEFWIYFEFVLNLFWISNSFWKYNLNKKNVNFYLKIWRTIDKQRNICSPDEKKNVFSFSIWLDFCSIPEIWFFIVRRHVLNSKWWRFFLDSFFKKKSKCNLFFVIAITERKNNSIICFSKTRS